MANSILGTVYKLDTVGSINTSGVRIKWIMHYADADAGEVKISDESSGNDVFYYKNVDVSVLGNYQFFFLGGQPSKGLYLTTLTASNLVWIGLE